MYNTKITTCAAFACLVAALAAAAPARADSPPNNSVRLGMYAVFYHASADDISGPYVPPGVNLNVHNVQTLYAAYVRRLSTHFNVEFAFGMPPKTETYGKGPATLGSVPYNGVMISTARWFAPTVLLNYVFLGDDSPVRPYIGVGVNYTTFYDRQSSAAGNAANGGPTRLSLTPSVGPAATVGLTYHVGGHWNTYISYSITRVDSNLTADTAGVIRRTRIKFGPQALVLAVGYSF